MSLHSFIAHGEKGELLYETDAGPRMGLTREWWVKVYDIDEPEYVGAVYEDKARVAAPRSWFPKAMVRGGPVRPKLPQRALTTPRPILPQRAARCPICGGVNCTRPNCGER